MLPHSPVAAVAALKARRSPVLNTYDAFAIDAYIRASGRAVASFETAQTDVGVVHRWTLKGISSMS